jgi:predicted transcriptional regulator
MTKLTLQVDMTERQLLRLRHVAEHRSVTPEVLAEAYIEDWLNIEYANILGRQSRRGNLRDGPVAFDEQARESAEQIERDVQKIESRRASLQESV